MFKNLKNSMKGNMKTTLHTFADFNFALKFRHAYHNE